jgi:hypothetical protein
MWIGEHSVSFQVDSEHVDLFRRGYRSIANLRFADDAMALSMSGSLPQIVECFETSQSDVLTLRKTPDQLLLSDVLSYFSGRLEPIGHVGWIMNVLLNIACYLECMGLVHNAIQANSVFISPLRHSGMLLGGWWYAARAGTPITAVPADCLGVMPPDMMRTKRSANRFDLELIKFLGRGLLGDGDGAHLALDKTLPQPLVKWLLLPSRGKATADYRDWKYTVLPESFGAPKFIELTLTGKDLYK